MENDKLIRRKQVLELIGLSPDDAVAPGKGRAVSDAGEAWIRLGRLAPRRGGRVGKGA